MDFLSISSGEKIGQVEWGNKEPESLEEEIYLDSCERTITKWKWLKESCGMAIEETTKMESALVLMEMLQ